MSFALIARFLPIYQEDICRCQLFLRALAEYPQLFPLRNTELADTFFAGGSALSADCRQLLAGGMDEVISSNPLAASVLYQHFVDGRKLHLEERSEVSDNKIASVTQLFTPSWISQYLLHNSLGVLSKRSNVATPELRYFDTETEKNFPDSYFIEDPCDLRIIDPACGTGNMLLEAFFFLSDWLSSCGLSSVEASRQILSQSLAGLDIDECVVCLARSTLLCEALRRGLDFPTALSAVSSRILFFENNVEDGATRLTSKRREQLASASLFGSLLRISPEEATLQPAYPLLTRKYDLVLTNPPYLWKRGMSSKLRAFANEQYPDTKSDLCSMFIQRSRELAKENGCIAVVSMHGWMFLPSAENLRRRILQESRVCGLAHLGTRAFSAIDGEVVQTVACLIHSCPGSGIRPVVRAVTSGNAAEKAERLCRNDSVYARWTQEEYSRFPAAVLAYWLPDELAELFQSSESLGSRYAVKQGLATTDNAKFVRYWWEVPRESIAQDIETIEQAAKSAKRWFPYVKGNGARRWYGSFEHVVDWEDNGRRIKESIRQKYPYLNGKTAFVAKNSQWYFRRGISWSFVSSAPLAGRYMPGGAIFDVAASCIFPDEDSLFPILGLLNSPVADTVVRALNPTMNSQVGDICRIPLSKSYYKKQASLGRIAIRLAALERSVWNESERSFEFCCPALVKPQFNSGSLPSSAARVVRRSNWRSQRREELEARLKRVLLGESDDGSEVISCASSEKQDLRSLAVQLISYAVGLYFGRYRCSKADEVPQKCLLVSPQWQCVSVVERFLLVQWGPSLLEENLRWLADALGTAKCARSAIQEYFLKGFFGDHCIVYRKRPVYWQISSGRRAAFTCFLYSQTVSLALLKELASEILRLLEQTEKSSIQYTELWQFFQRVQNVIASVETPRADPTPGPEDGILTRLQQLGAILDHNVLAGKKWLK